MTDDARLIVPAPDDEPFPSLGFEVADWIEANLVYGPGDLLGQPKKLSDEELLFLVRAYEIYPEGATNKQGDNIGGRRRFKRAAYSRRKGLAKTELAAMIAIAECAPDGPVRFDGWRILNGERVPVGRPVVDPYIPMLAYTEEQVEELAYRCVYEILTHSPLGDEWDVTFERISPKDTTGRIVPTATSPGARDGARTTFEHADEPHRMISERQRQAWQTMLRNLMKRKAADPWALETSTMYGPNENSVFEGTHLYALAIQRGEIKDPDLYFDHRQASEKWDISKDGELVKAILEASGDAAEWTDVDAIKSRFRDPTADENEERRYLLNQRRASSRKWGVVKVWDDRRLTGVTSPVESVEDRRFVLAFDGSQNRDSTILVAATVEATPHLFLVGAWERPLLHAGNWRVNRSEVMATIDAWLDRDDLVEFAPDPPGWYTEIESLEERFGELVVRFETRQVARMAPALDKFEQAVRDGTLTHDGSEVLARHLTNVVPIYDKLDKIVAIRKEMPDSPNKIDAAVAAVVAYDRANWHYAHSSDDVGAFVIDLNRNREAA